MHICILFRERFGNRLKIVKEIPDEIMDYTVPRLIIQPILENAVEYGAGFRHQGTRERFYQGIRKENIFIWKLSMKGSLLSMQRIK